MMPQGERAVEELLKAVGGAWTQLPLLALLAAVCALGLNTQLLAFVTPDHWCYNTEVAAIQTQLPLSPQDAKKFSLPPVTIGLSLLQQWVPQNISVTYSQCERYDGDLVAAYISWTAAKRPLFIKDIQGVSAPRNLSVRTCDQGWVYNYTNFYTTLTTQSSWVCGDSWRPHFVHLAFWVAAGLGALGFGIIAERFGESLVIIVALSTTLAGQVLTLATTNFLSVMLARIVVGLPYLAIRFISIAHVVCLSRTVSETKPSCSFCRQISHIDIPVMGMCESRHRVWPFVILLFSQTVTTLIVTATILAVSSWWFLALGSAVVCAVCLLVTWSSRWFLALGSAVCLLVTWRLFLESPWWLLSRGRHAESQTVLYKMAAINRRQPPALDADNLQKLSELLQVAPGGSTMHCCCQDNIPFSLLEPRDAVWHRLLRPPPDVTTCPERCHQHETGSAHHVSSLLVHEPFRVAGLSATLSPGPPPREMDDWITCGCYSVAGGFSSDVHDRFGEYNQRLPPLLLACVSLLGAMLSLALPSGTAAVCLTENHNSLFHRARRLIQQWKLRAKTKTSRQDTNLSPCVSYNQLYFT
uniref:Uncharacterized protein n=1 Tax=Timema monikensis TaxID=170555 RepID=A0A7R9EA27_9NEOP|nr:unnamed protein product [Timema monikensis]